MTTLPKEGKTPNWDHSSHERFYDYYAKVSESEETLLRFRSIRDRILKIVESNQSVGRTVEVADIGCGAGAQSMMWAELGHRVYGLDVNQPLVELAKKRAVSAGYTIDFRVGSAVELPWENESIDVCLAIELLEHVAEWKTCLHEFMRVLRPGGVLFLTTTNRLCPIQQEFNLPLYSWYPNPLKHYFERLAVTTSPELTNFAKYPAVNWFSFYGLRTVLTASGFQCLDRFDMVDLSNKNIWVKLLISTVRTISVVRWLAHIATPGTMIAAIKKKGVLHSPDGQTVI